MHSMMSRWRSRIISIRMLVMLLILITLFFGYFIIRNVRQAQSSQEQSGMLSRMYEQNLRSESDLRIKLSSAGSTAGSRNGRTQNYVTGDQYCFVVENPENLDKYTDNEIKILDMEAYYSRY